jgi:hypothetical protein
MRARQRASYRHARGVPTDVLDSNPAASVGYLKVAERPDSTTCGGMISVTASRATW